jgi:crotonobetainyl-CoA:carnitine CoA-transferase CaiB-like acyl-CoA transferase
MQSTGEQDREPVKLGLTVEQFFCGAMAASGVMGAFLGCALQGIGQHLDLSMYELMVGNQDRAFTALTAYQFTGDLLQRAGMQEPRASHLFIPSPMASFSSSPFARLESIVPLDGPT